MHLCGLRISNFRCFGDGKDSFTLRLKPGLTAIVGQNDAGKTAVIDALRFALGTTDQEWYRLEDEDFHREAGKTAPQITIQCQFALEPNDTGAFVEYLTYSKDAKSAPALFVNWIAKDTGERRRGRPSRHICAYVVHHINADMLRCQLCCHDSRRPSLKLVCWIASQHKKQGTPHWIVP
jgi:putative ATP-dependent endonuclease of OLD family